MYGKNADAWRKFIPWGPLIQGVHSYYASLLCIIFIKTFFSFLSFPLWYLQQPRPLPPADFPPPPKATLNTHNATFRDWKPRSGTKSHESVRLLRSRQRHGSITDPCKCGIYKWILKCWTHTTQGGSVRIWCCGSAMAPTKSNTPWIWCLPMWAHPELVYFGGVEIRTDFSLRSRLAIPLMFLFLSLCVENVCVLFF